MTPLQDISELRFNALAAYCRTPQALAAAEEVRWLQSGSEAILVVVIRDRPDQDYGALILARDARERYRCVDVTEFFPTIDEAVAQATARAGRIAVNLDAERLQGDERGAPIDFFAPLRPEASLNPDFVRLSGLEGYSPARKVIEPMMRWYEDADGNFVEQFQTSGFDARMWELYLFATLVEAGYALDRRQAVPDFHARGLFGEFFIEATTVNPRRDERGNLVPPPPLDAEDQMHAFQHEYVPIRYGGPLTAKLAKRYWERDNVQGKALLLAIQDFHAPMSMTISRGGLPTYLYGFAHDWHHDPDGTLIITPHRVEVHRWGSKEIPSGFFRLPGAENISAVIFNNSATISKFNRMGLLAGFGSHRVRMIRQGVALDLDPNAAEPRKFAKLVHEPDYRETWIEGMDVFHNPGARVPIEPDLLPGAAHHWLQDDGRIDSLAPAWQPLSSQTLITIEP
ncbi:MAG: hypothetical protein IAE86_11405 [Burkholderiaceae bacterium]|nr:hypothetical protein [Burkholderiaceae bacterium]